MLENKEFFRTGLCALAVNLLSYNIINENEYDKIRRYIKCNKPKPGSSLYCTDGQWGYYWPSHQWKPREKWLKYHIQKLTKKK